MERLAGRLRQLYVPPPSPKLRLDEDTFADASNLPCEDRHEQRDHPSERDDADGSPRNGDA